MCKLTKRLKKGEKRVGYKVCLMHEEIGEFYSVAMGFRYRSGKKVPTPKRQIRICTFFNKDLHIEDYAAGYASDMVGRTAVFSNRCCAENKAGIIDRDVFKEWTKIEDGYKICVVMAEVSCSVMRGFYGSSQVYAGRIITFLPDVYLRVL